MVSQTDFDIYLITDRGRILPQSYDCVVKLFPGENFSIVATNNTNLKTKAKFYLSGTYVGTLVIPKFQRCELKRPIEGVDRCFIYCEFGTSIAEKAKLDPNKPHSDELTVIFYPEYISERKYSAACATYAAACADGATYAAACADGSGISVPDGFNQYKASKIESDYGGIRGGAILGATKTHQKFFEASDFVTCGKYCFTLVLRSIEAVRQPEIIPLCDMYKYN